jgi:hypothetical protein
MSWERLFQKPSFPANAKVPNLTPDQAADFRLQTEERVSREKHIEREATSRNDADIALREEMHSFGMIQCEYFDPETKLIGLNFAEGQTFSVPARSFPHANYTDKIWASSAVTVNGEIEVGRVITLTPKIITMDDTGFVTDMTFDGVINIDNKVFRAKLVVTRPIVDVQSGKATLFLGLASSYDDGNSLTVPNLADSANITYPYQNLKFYK